MTAESTNFQISNSDAGKIKMSDMEKNFRNSVNLTPVYLEQVINFINSSVQDPAIRDKVIARAKSYPHSALQSFLNRFQSIVVECTRIIQEKRTKESQNVVSQTTNNKVIITTNDLLNLQDSLDLQGEKPDVNAD